MNQKDYYRISAEASKNENHPAQIAIKRYAIKAKKILDLGCGDGTRLERLSSKAKKYGVDISDYAIDKAKNKYPKIEFIKADISKLPFKEMTYDLVYSMFVIEHVKNPEDVLDEAIRVLKKGGVFILGAPNYGAPNRHSPVSEENKFFKLINGLFKKSDGESLNWSKVTPTKGKYFIDSDTQVEPYILSLIEFLRKSGLKLIKASSLWETDNFSINQLVFRVLGQIGIRPFKWWGPQIFIIAKKIQK